MICKFCGNQKIALKFKLKNARVFVCDNCDFHFTSYLDPEISENNIIDDKPISEHLKIYLANQLQFNKLKFENQVKIVKRYLSGSLHSKILDVGCGGGLFLSSLKNERIECYGIEPEIERLKYSRQETNIKDIYPYPIEAAYWNHNHAASFDVITIWDVIEHVNDPKSLIEHANLLLKTGGIIFIDTPCRNTFYHRFGELTYNLSFGKYPTFLNIMYSDHPFGHKQILAKKDIKTLLELFNFKILELHLFHELSFPSEYYVKKLILNNTLQKICVPMVKFLLKCLTIQNKMLIVAIKE